MNGGGASRDPAPIRRKLGVYDGPEPGPLVLAFGGIHGNEPAGVRALSRIMAALHTDRPRFRGNLIALAGNLGALAAGKRYIDRDLNRVWFPAGGLLDLKGSEAAERVELLAEIDEAIGRRRGPAVFLDLHTTSAGGFPFAMIGDTLANRDIAFRIPAPVILGLEEHLEGTLLNFAGDLGYAAIGFEGGQNESSQAVENCEAATWLVLEAAGCIRSGEVRQVRESRTLLETRCSGTPRVAEVRYRHAIPHRATFRMLPGFSNFDRVRARQVLAEDDQGEVRAGENALILMPLYQSQGDDGFFLVRPIHAFWLDLSAWLRRLGIERLLDWLPGVSFDSRERETLVIDRHLARWYSLQIFHLFGYRKVRTDGALLLVSRRRGDVPFRSKR
jgi:succinylglutamate desuccinylase